MKLGRRAKFALVLTPLPLMIVLGFLLSLPFDRFHTTILGFSLLVGSALLNTLALLITKKIVGKLGPGVEVNSVARESLLRGTANRDQVLLWISILALVSFFYFTVYRIWLFMVAGLLGMMLLDLLNDYLALRKSTKPE